ncbi:MAG: dTDP-glucose 4,6-dehydratase [Spirochaetia bacterium]|nr:dTDP-glucose 4,6-dehydratase [Spirochaetia bacterium]
MRTYSAILVSGGAGFIGSNFIRYLLGPESGFQGLVVNVDALSYAGNLDNLSDLAAGLGGTRYFFERADICDRAAVEDIVARYRIDAVCHLAAESHVDRSIMGPEAFVRTNVLGTFTLLDVVRQAWRGRDGVWFHQVSTDEVYGTLGPSGSFSEASPYAPRSPYSASKAAADHLVMAYHHSYGLPVSVSNCGNNYGPRQFPEKLVPLMILNMLEGKRLPVYGDGRQVRDWLYVDDHARAVWAIMRGGRPGHSYVVGGGNERENLSLVERLADIVAEETGAGAELYRGLITLVPDRPGHDRRYALDSGKIRRELGWEPRVEFDRGLRETVRWYLDNPAWIERVRSGVYRRWLDSNYGWRQGGKA